MGHKHTTTVTQEGVTKSQPNAFVGVVYPYQGKVRLNAHRYYDNVTNDFLGKGKSKSLDHDGKLFDNTEQAWQFALSHGYSRPWYPRSLTKWDEQSFEFERVVRAAKKTIERGEYHGKRKLTKVLINKLQQGII